MILDEIITNKLNPRLFDRQRQTDFIDCVRLLGDIIDSYPYDQQIVTNRFLINKRKTNQLF
jgi:hypothetical protein